MEDADETCEICDKAMGPASVCLDCWNPTVKENLELLEQIKDFKRENHKLLLQIKELQKREHDAIASKLGADHRIAELIDQREERDKLIEKLKTVNHRQAEDVSELDGKLQESNRLYDECLKIAEAHQSYSPQPNPSDMDRGWKACARDIAESIRQLKQTERPKDETCGATPPGDPSSGPCKKRHGHGGVCENDQFVWDWKPTPYVRGDLPPMQDKQEKRKDTGITEVCPHCWGDGSNHVVGGPREKCVNCDGTGKA